MSATELVLSRLKGVRRTSAGWMTRCPAHEDRNASLSIAEGNDGRVLLNCHAGCPAEAIVSAMGLKLADLFPPRDPSNNGGKPRIVATYGYADANRTLLFQTVRFEPKDFRQRRPDPARPGEWIWNLKGVRRVLYRLPDVLLARETARTVFVCEGEKDCDAVAKSCLIATCNPMGAGKWLPDHTETLRGAARVVIIADKDAPGRQHAQAVATALLGVAQSVKLIELPDRNDHRVKDAADWFAAGGTSDELKALVMAAPEFVPAPDAQPCQAGSVAAEHLGDEALKETDEQAVARLAALPLLEYERMREAEAKRLKCRTTTLDRMVEAKRPQKVGEDLQGRAVDLADVEPWPEQVDGASVLSQIAETFGRYVVLPDGAADALALWCAHAHAFRAFICSPRLNVSSPEKGCGKTTLRDVVALFVPRPLPTENLSVAVLFRLVESQAPTILADECDAWLRDNEELRGLLNAGHRRGAVAYRCEGDSHEVRGFRVFAPAVLCGIGSLPGTLHDRSIVIRLERAKPGELRQRFDSRHTQLERELSRKLARWCADSGARLEAADPALPPGAFNRLADNWRPLFAVAEAAGGDWALRAAAAFGQLTSREDADAQGIGAALLADIRQAFTDAHRDRMFSKTLVEFLCALSDRPWPEAHKGRPITEVWLARRLHSFGITPRTLRIGDDRAKGYEAADFTEAFARYLPAAAEFIRDSVTTRGNTGPRPTFQSVTPAPLVTAPHTHETPVNIGLSRCHASKAPASVELVETLL